jgi:hypothetical protein
MSGAAEGPPPTPADAGALARSALADWARITEAIWHNAMALASLPLELAQQEDPTLGVCHASVWFVAPKRAEGWGGSHHGGALSCAALKNATSDQTLGQADVTIDAPAIRFDGTPQEVVIRVPGTIAPGLYEVTLHEETTNTEQSYVLPFGVPR